MPAGTLTRFGSLKRRDLDRRSQADSAVRYLSPHQQVVAVPGKNGIRFDVDMQVQIPGGSATGMRTAFSRDSQATSLFNSRRNTNLDLFYGPVAAVVDSAFSALYGKPERNADLH